MKKCFFASLLLLLPALCFGLTVDAPTAGELIPAGSVYTSIQWTPTAGSTKFNVYASFDNGLTWSTPLNKTGKVSGTPFGSLVFDPSGANVQGIAMENGQGFMVIDTATVGESSLTIGLKKAK